MKVCGSAQVQAGVTPSFTDTRGFSSVVREAVGVYSLFFETNYAETEVNVNVTPYGATNGRCARTLNGVESGTGRTWVKVWMVDDDNTPADIDFVANAVSLA